MEIKLRRQISLVHGRNYSVGHLIDNFYHYYDFRKRKRYSEFRASAFQFFQEIHDGKTFTDDELIHHPYFEHLQLTYRVRYRNTPKINGRCIEIMREGIELYHDIKQNGLRAPLEMWIQQGKLNLYRGIRRLIIAHFIGQQNIGVRIFKNRNALDKLSPYDDKIDETIRGLGVKHFNRYGTKGTDKYWIHNYLLHYDKHLSGMRDSAEKVLEIGVKRGMSLLFWTEIFSKAAVYGIDIDIKQAWRVKDNKRITLLKGAQEDVEFLKRKVIPHGKFDLVVDDGDHIGKHQIATFRALWDSVAKGGYYVIEDLLYRNPIGGKDDGNAINMLKGLVDELYLSLEISSIHFYCNICFIEKR